MSHALTHVSSLAATLQKMRVNNANQQSLIAMTNDLVTAGQKVKDVVAHRPVLDA